VSYSLSIKNILCRSNNVIDADVSLVSKHDVVSEKIFLNRLKSVDLLHTYLAILKINTSKRFALILQSSSQKYEPNDFVL